MATKKAATTTEKPISKTEAVRQALADDPTLSGATGAEYLMAKFGLKITPAMFSNYKSVQGRKSGTSSGKGGGKKKGDVTYTSPTLDDLKRAKEFVATLNLSAKKTFEIVTAIQEFGDGRALRDSLQFWTEHAPTT